MMIKFLKKYSNLLPYSKKQYLEYFDDDIDGNKIQEQWYGYSIQLDTNENSHTLSEKINFLTPILRDIILSFGMGVMWIVSHNDKDMDWFNEYNKGDVLPILWNSFNKKDIIYPFKGGIEIDSESLLSYIKNLLEYAPILSYKNLDISNVETPFIIKLTGHITIDLLSNDADLLNKYIPPNMKDLKIVKYRQRISPSTSLL